METITIINTILTNDDPDLMIVCRDGRQFKVHKSILCSHSPVLTAACAIDMRERHTGVIEHKEFDSDTVELMVQFIYAGAYLVTKRPTHLWLLEMQEKMEKAKRRAENAEVEETEAENTKAEKTAAELEKLEDQMNDFSRGVRGARGLLLPLQPPMPLQTESYRQAAAHSLRERFAAVADRAAQASSSTPIASSQDSQDSDDGYSEYLDWSSDEAYTLDLGGEGTSSDNESKVVHEQHKLITHAQMYGLADYYQMEDLSQYALENFITVAEGGFDLQLTPRTFIEVAREVRARTDALDDPLRASLIELFMRHASDLCEDHYFVNHLGGAGLIGIAADMLDAVAQQIRSDDQEYHARRRELMTVQRALIGAAGL